MSFVDVPAATTFLITLLSLLRTCTEWYRAYITFASSNRLSWDVEYEDGDVGYDLCPACIRPFVPYAVGETVEIRMDAETFAKGRITFVQRRSSIQNNIEWIDVQLEESGESLRRVHPRNIRRFTADRRTPVTGLAVHARVLAMFPGEGDQWFPGYVSQLNPDGTVAVSFDDGDYDPRISPRNIRLP